MPADEAHRADEILLARAERDFEEGLAHARQRIRETHGRLAAGTLDALVMGAVATLGLRSRMKDDVRHLLALAHRVAAGEPPRPLAEAEIDRVMRMKQSMGLLARVDDPEFQHVRALALDLFARRLPDLARLASVPDPVDYDDLVRKAFPDRAEVDALVQDNARTMEAIIAHLEKHPHVLRMPSGLTPKIAATARDMVAWKVGEVARGVDEIYAGQRKE